MYKVYRINFKNGKFYIGKTNNIKRRINAHKNVSHFKDELKQHYTVEILAEFESNSEALTYESKEIGRHFNDVNNLNSVNPSEFIEEKKSLRSVSLSDLEVKAIRNIPEAEGSLTKGIRFLLRLFSKK